MISSTCKCLIILFFLHYPVMNCDEIWVDPHDMMNYDTDTKEDGNGGVNPTKYNKMDCMDIRKELAICIKKSKSASEHCDANKDLTTVNIFFKHFIRTVSNNFCSQYTNVDDGYHQIDLTLTDLQCSYLKESLEEKHSMVTLQEVHYILNNMTSINRWIPRVTLPGLVDVWCDYLQENIKVVFMISASVAMLLNIIYILSKLRLSFYRLIFITTALLFLISVPWTWWYLYKKALASKMATLSKNPPDSCSPQKISFFDTLYSYFHFTENECLKYYEALQALAVTFAKFFLEPIEYLGEAIKKLFVSALNGVPFFLQPFIVVFIVLMFVLMLFVCSGYRFRSLLFNIEPSRNTSISSAEKALLKGLQDEIDKLEQKLKDLRLQEGRMIEDGSGDAKVQNVLPISSVPASSSSVSESSSSEPELSPSSPPTPSGLLSQSNANHTSSPPTSQSSSSSSSQSSSASSSPPSSSISSPSTSSVQKPITLPSITADFRLS